jgi:hypothetical protein
VKRTDQKQASTRYLHVRVTPEEEGEIKALAEYASPPHKETEAYSEMFRRLVREERKRLKALGLRPPLKPRAT